ncbi:MAG: glutamate--tRNA ligase, partial [Bacteroidales bacterium]|nr:glutamate--tRNA ligase [Bacteroidales bacterium]
PSPTGYLHIGGARTALFNWLYAKKTKGKFILRIEDTDQTRYVANAEQYIVDALNWCNIPFDEGPNKNEKFGPYRQSERKHLYKQYADQLIESGNAYYCFDTSEELDYHRKDHEEKGKTFIYNWHNRAKLTNSISLTKDEVEQRIANGDNYVVRFKMHNPLKDGESSIISTTDIIRGNVSFKKELLDDKILFKSDGMPTYHLANIVDDYLMKISHVIRGEEWLPSLPLHVLLYKAFGWESKMPEFAHLPLILKPQGKGKLSKRDGDKMGFPVFPLEWKDPKTNEISAGYRESGYFPDALNNILALLGWNPGIEQEFFSLEKLTELFSLEKVGKSGSRFDPEKAKWFNQHYLREKSNANLALEFQKILNTKDIKADLAKIEKIVELVKERSVFISDFWPQSDFFFLTPTEYDAKTVKKRWKEESPTIIESINEIIKGIDNFTSAILEEKVKSYISENELNMGAVMNAFRLAIVGAAKGPHLFDILEIIGKDESILRLENAIKNIGK